MQAVIDSLSTGVPKALKELARLGRTRRISAWPLPCADQRSMSTTRRPAMLGVNSRDAAMDTAAPGAGATSVQLPAA